MIEESPLSFQKENIFELVHVYIQSQLKKAGINLQKFGININDNVITITTDKKLPEEIISNICQYAAYKGTTIKFLTSG